MSYDLLLGLGSNLGDREAQLEESLRLLAGTGFVPLLRSSLYLTEPVDAPVPQGWFVNAVVHGRTDHGPGEMLRECLAIEKRLGRERRLRNGPRTIDLDILLFGVEVRTDSQLTLPHPRLHERRFVLVPAAEIVPDCRHPVLGRTVAELLEACPDRSAVRWHRPAEAWVP